MAGAEMTPAMTKLALTLGGAAIAAIALYAMTLLPHGQRLLGSLESIHGIPFPVVNNATIIEEDMAHADIYLNGPVFAKAARINITFIPNNITRLDVGIRDNPFWLSYTKHPLYTRQLTTNYQLPTTNSVTIPLTDKLQEPDQSIDMMLFITDDKPYLAIESLSVDIIPAWPTWTELKNYARSILIRERAL